MRLISLELTEWRAYERCFVEFPDGLIGVGGPNGAGKSTIVEAVGWVLFGKLRPGAVAGDLRRQGGGGRPTAQLVFQLVDTLYTVRRVSGGECLLWIGHTDAEPEASGATNVSRRIVQELDLTWSVFKRSVFAEQKDLAALDPKQTGPQRRAHVEQLLGLARFKRAADKARNAVKAVNNEITGRLAELDDEDGLNAELVEAECVAEEESPRVNELKEQLEAAEEEYKSTRTAVEQEHGRATRGAGLQARQEAASRSADTAAGLAQKLQRRIEERDDRQRRLGKLEPEARLAPAAKKELEAFDALQQATEELEAAREQLAETRHDPDVARRDEETLEQLTHEREALQGSTPSLVREIEQLQGRRAALADVAHAGAPDDHAHLREQAVEDERRLDRELSHLQRRLDEDRQHIEAVRSGGPQTRCAVCRKRYGDDYEEILATHEAAVASAEHRLPAAKTQLAEAVAAREGAEERRERAILAARALAATQGPDSLTDCESVLEAREKRVAREQARERALEEELPPLQTSVRAARARSAGWATATAVARERERVFERAAKAAGRESYDAAAHGEARLRSERLEGVAEQADRLREQIAEAKGLEVEQAEAAEQAEEQRSLAERLASELEELGLEPGRLDELRDTCLRREEHRDQLREQLQDAKLAAQGHSQAVAELRRRLAALRKALQEVEKRRVDLRRDQVAADLLEQYRQYESQRAWPQLQQGASALLAAATGGRYADIRLSPDYKLTIVDRGEEHGLARYSGGEQDLANLCLRLAIAEWVARERGTDISLVILDEVFGSQDEERRQLLLDQLRSLSTRFRQMLIVTHLPDIADMCDARIEVSIDDAGTSTAVVAA